MQMTPLTITVKEEQCNKTYAPFLPYFCGSWVEVRDGNPYALNIHSRHYSKYQYKDGRKPNRLVGPGERMVLITEDGKALFVWRKFKSMNNQDGINCAVFRNEGTRKSSALIAEAVKLAWDRWPGERLYTYVSSEKVRSVNPGFCFKVAGWKFCGKTKKRGLHILEKLCPQK
jgi:hypothetical protein